ncbi:MAG: DNA-3-methyladenine glycosylase 2 family protein [Sphaerobacter sp.]|nr:DNA-3-methyladenine glycosylase 2 family protein [Sphaerobacter sp.]
MSAGAQQIEFTIEPEPPYRLDLTVWVLRRRPDYVVDRWDGRVYRRLLPVDGRAVAVAVTQIGTTDAPCLRVVARGPALDAHVVPDLRRTLERMLGTGVDLGGFARLAAGDPALASLARRLRGAKPTRYPTVYEALVNAIACQQITLTFGLRIVSRLAQECGLTVERDGEALFAFPRPADVLTLSPERLVALGFSRQKARAVLELSERLVDGTLDLDDLETLPDDAALARLRALRGVGRWTAEYVLLRGLGRLHVFPGDDVGGRNNLRRWLGIDEALDYDGVQRVLAAWRDYGGLLYFYLLLLGLAESGYVAVDDPGGG